MAHKLGSITIGQTDVDFATSSIRGDSGQFSIEPKVMKVLEVLMSNAGDVVERDTLIHLVWGAPYGSDQQLSRAISLLRKAFGGTGGKCKHIETISKRGYRFIAPLSEKFITPVENRQPLPLKSSKASSVNAPELSIAVLPFADMSEQKNQDYLADGICEEIINALAQVSELRVTGRTSSFAFKDRNEDLSKIAQILNVAYLLEGSVRKNGDRIRVTAQLIQSSDGFHLFSKTYEGELSEIFDLQDRIAYAIVNKLYELFELPKQQGAQNASTKSTQAYELFLRGRQLVHKRNGQTTIPAGIEFLKQSIEIDPDFALAWAWLALAHFVLPEFSRTRDWANHLEQSRQAVDRALKLQPNCSIGLVVKAMSYELDGKLDLAISAHKNALDVDPNNVNVLGGMGLGLMAIGLYEDAKYYFDRVLEQDPLCGIWHTTYGGVLISAGEPEKAKNSFKRSFELGFGAAAFGVSHRLACEGNADQAVEFMKNNFDGLGPIEQAELKSPLVRHLVYNAFFRKAKLARVLVTLGLRLRLRNPAAQPTSASVVGFFFLNQPKDFMRSVLQKPNPYTGYAIARVWEPTEESRNIRMHPDFPEFAEQIGLIKAWQQHGWPKQLLPSSPNDNATPPFSVID